jgi:hypothetical protein
MDPDGIRSRSAVSEHEVGGKLMGVYQRHPTEVHISKASLAWTPQLSRQVAIPVSVKAAATGRIMSIPTARSSMFPSFAIQQPPWTTIATG